MAARQYVVGLPVVVKISEGGAFVNFGVCLEDLDNAMLDSGLSEEQADEITALVESARGRSNGLTFGEG